MNPPPCPSEFSNLSGHIAAPNQKSGGLAVRASLFRRSEFDQNHKIADSASMSSPQQDTNTWKIPKISSQTKTVEKAILMKTQRSIKLAGIFFTLMTVWLTTRTYAGFTAALGETPLAEIIIPQNPSEAELFAAEELQNYVYKIGGATLPIRETSQVGSQSAFVIGNLAANSNIQNQLTSLYPGKYDRFAVVAQGQLIHFVAPHSSGLLYSVWSWLEDKQGVSWLLPGEKGTYIPQKNQLL